MFFHFFSSNFITHSSLYGLLKKITEKKTKENINILLLYKKVVFLFILPKYINDIINKVILYGLTNQKNEKTINGSFN